MIDYTLSAIDKIKTDLKRTFFVFNLFLQILYISYLVYAIVADVGNLIANIVLVTISFGYFVFCIFSYDKISWGQSKTARRAYSWSKLFVTAFTAGVAVYGICATATNVTVPAVILVSLMVVSWVLRVILEVFICFFEIEASIFVEGIKADMENAVKPVKTVGNTIKKIVGAEVEPDPEPNKYRKILDQKVAERRTNRREKNKERIRKLFSFGKKAIEEEKEEKEESFK